MKADDAMNVYFSEAATWDDDRVASTQRRERVAWRVAIGSMVLTLLSAIALVLLLPLKTVEPFMVRVNSESGVVDVVPQFTGVQDIDPVVTRYLIGHYIRVCERFYFAAALHDYEECGVYNSQALNQDLYRRWTPSNPESPLQVNRDGTTLRAHVISISFLDATRTRKVAQVRYYVARRASGTGTEKLTHYIGTIEFRYVTPSRDARVRQLNPMGLRIEDFRRELEVPGESTRLGSRGASNQATAEDS